MKKEMKYLAVFVSIFAVTVVGCTQKAADSGDAIENAQTKGSVDQQVSYLVSQANVFLNSEQYDEAVKTAKHILANLDNNSTEAKGILDKAKEELQKLATEKLNEATGDLKGKLGGFGN